MGSFLQKLRTVTLGTAHDLLDKAIDLNSPSALRQYVRDLEDAMDKLRSEAAVQAGQVRTVTREIGDLQHQIETGTNAARLFQEQGKMELAKAKASLVVQAQSRLEGAKLQLATQQQTSQQLDIAVQKLEARHTEMVQNVRRLESMDRTTKANEAAARSLSQAGKVVSGGADISIDDIETRMQARSDVASEKLQRAMGAVELPEDPEHDAAVDSLLASLKPSKAVNQ